MANLVILLYNRTSGIAREKGRQMAINCKTPSVLKKAGRSLWKWLDLNCDGLPDAAPLALELCKTADRLEWVRAQIALAEIAQIAATTAAADAASPAPPRRGRPRASARAEQAAAAEQAVKAATDLRRLIDTEKGLQGIYSRIWRQLGLSDRTDDARRPVGRPSTSDVFLERVRTG